MLLNRHPDFPAHNECNNCDTAPREHDANDNYCCHSEGGDNEGETASQEAMRGNVPLLQVEGFG